MASGEFADSQIPEDEPWVPTESARGQGNRPRNRGGRGRGRRARGAHDMPTVDAQRQIEFQNARVEKDKAALRKLSKKELLDMSMFCLEHDPGLIYFALRPNLRQAALPDPPDPGELDWCVCQNCRVMPTDVENLCCGQRPAQCVSTLPHMEAYILAPGVLHLAAGIWNDVRAQADPQNPVDRNRQLRHAAYRNFVMWQHGVLGRGNRVVIPSCCVLKVRSRFPDPHGQYVGFLPTRV